MIEDLSSKIGGVYELSSISVTIYYERWKNHIPTPELHFDEGEQANTG
jgi:hypothetical protein